MLGRYLVLTLAVVLTFGTACKEAPSKRAAKVADGKEFWPEAPKATTKTGTRTFSYKPENINAYKLTAEGGTPPGAKIGIEYSMTLDLDFKAGATPRERNAYIKLVDLTMDAVGEKMKMRLDGAGMMIKSGNEEPMEMKRGDDGPFDVGGMTDKPFTTLVFNEANGVDVRSIDDHPFNSLGGTGDMLDNALVLFPDLPSGAVAPGHRWSIKRNTPVGATGSRVDIKYDFVYVGDGACPSGAKACSLLSFTAASKDVEVTSEAMTMTVSYGFAGKVFFDTDKAVVDESRVRMDLDVKSKPIDMTIGGTFIVKPR